MNIVEFNEERCKSCGLCVSSCPKGILAISKTKMNEKGYRPAEILKPEQCIGCACCALMCPDCAISVYREG